jgi:7-carboxy-7-deazaguanine synthase
MSLEDVIDAVAAYPSKYVTVTGGEPLAQRACADLLRRLCEAGYDVSLETSGALDISGVDASGRPDRRHQDSGLRRGDPQPLD